MGEVAVLEAVFEGALRAGGGMGEVMGEARVGSLVGDAGEAVVGELGAPGASGGGVAHRGRLLENDEDAAARGVYDRLFGLVGKAVFPQTVSEEQSGS